MITNEQARKEVKLLKAMNDIKYLEFAEMVDMSSSSLYCWLNRQYDLGEERLSILEYTIANLKGE